MFSLSISIVHLFQAAERNIFFSSNHFSVASRLSRDLVFFCQRPQEALPSSEAPWGVPHALTVLSLPEVLTTPALSTAATA